MARSLVAAIEGSNVKITDGNDSLFGYGGAQGELFAFTEGDLVIVHNGAGKLSAPFGEWTTPSGASAAAVANDLNTNYFLVSGSGDLPSNVVVVESKADLPAISANKSTLDSTKIYQWVGDITIDDRNIDLNNAQIRGNFPSLDKITFTNGFGFTGSEGGSLVNLTLSSSGAAAGAAAGKLFNLAGSTAKSLTVLRCVISGCQNIGTVDDLLICIWRYNSYAGNTLGVIFTDITYMGRIAGVWLNTNAGTYETYVGTFTIIQLVDGLYQTAGGTTGLDVSGVTTISEAGQCKDNIFSGAGTYVTGTFSSDWEVNSYGITTEEDDVATCDIYWNASAVTLTPTQNVWVRCSGTTVQENAFRFDDNGGTNNSARYTGKKTVKKKVSGHFSVTSSVNNKTYEWTFADVSSGVTASDEKKATRRKISTGTDVGAIGIGNEFSFDTNTEIALYVRCIDATTGNMTIELGNFEI